MEFLPPEVRTLVEDNLGASYVMFRTVRSYVPHEVLCPICGGVTDSGEPYDINCKHCINGYQITWVVQEMTGRMSDITRATLIFASVTPGIEVGDKLLTVGEDDAATLQAVQASAGGYVQADDGFWRPFSVQPSSFGQHQEWVAHLRRHTPKALYD